MNIVKRIAHYFYPNRCPLCNKVILADEKFCEKCKEKFPEFVIKSCAIGGIPCVSPFFYCDNFAKAVRRLKFNNRTQFAYALSFPLCEVISKEYSEIKFDCITYVPMHKTKYYKRGYNQAQLLAKHCSQNLNMPLEKLLIKHKNNKEQHNCTKKEKEKNVRGVYKEADKNIIKGKTVLLIDDVITSGYTLGECCKILYKNGATNICCATVCSTSIHKGSMHS